MPDALPLAAQLYSVRGLPGGLDGQLRAVTDAGYTAVETVGAHGLEPAQVRAALDAHGVRAVSSHVPLDALRADPAPFLELARAIGTDTLVVPWLPEERRPTDAAGWRALGAELDALGARCAGEGIRLLYHNHDFELVECEGRPGIVWLLDAASEDHLGFEPDLAWIVRGGGDPERLLARYAGRCARVHLKDLSGAGPASEEGGWASVGRGTMDWDRLLTAAAAAGAQWYVVEHDQPRDAVATLRESRSFLSGRIGRAASA